MKRFLFSFIFVSLAVLLGACSKEIEKTNLSVILPNGAPALAQAQLEHNGNTFGSYTATVDRVSDTALLTAAFTSETYDVIYAPTNLGAKMYNNNGKYLYAANITWGNIFFATADNSNFSVDSLDDATVYLFGQGTINETIIDAVLADKGISIGEKIWMSSTTDTKNQLILDPTSIVMAAEPVLSAAKAALSKQGHIVNTISLQTLWSDYSESGSYPQAGVFIKADVTEKYSDLVESYLDALKTSCEFTGTNANDVANYATELNYGLPAAAVLVNAIPNSNILYKSASDSKNALETVFNLNLSLIGGRLPDEGFYAY